MLPEYLSALQRCQDDMIEDLIVADFLPELRTCKSFTLDDQEIILHEITSKAKATKLLEKIRVKDEECFEKFRDILRRTNEDLAESLEKSINNFRRERKNSVTDYGNILINGGVPDRKCDYIQRSHIDNEILKIINGNSNKPILIHGILGCGKTNIVSHFIHKDGLFPFKFTNCCWMPVGVVNENDIVRKLAILWNKLCPDRILNGDIIHNIPEILVESIKNKLQIERTLLILDDIRSEKIIKYFTFPFTYIVTSRNAKLFPDGCAEVVQLPDKFTNSECLSFLEYNGIDELLMADVIRISNSNPMLLSLASQLLKSNTDFDRLTGELDVNSYAENIFMECINILDDNTKEYYKMLAILQHDETVTLEVLSIFWGLKNVDALRILNTVCDNNFLYKNWRAEYAKNTYGVYDIHLDYLKKINVEELKTYQNMFVSRYRDTYKSWLDINLTDPFFLIFYVKLLYNRNDLETINRLYSDYSFIAAKIVLCGIADLLLDYEKYCRPARKEHCDQFEKFLMKNSHKFIKLPENKDIILKMGKIFTRLIQLGLYEMKDSCTYKAACNARNLSKRKDFWDWINPKSSIKIWETSQDEDIVHVDVNETRILMCNKNGRVRLLDSNNGKCIFDYKISDEVILVQFTSDRSFIIVDSNGQFWIFAQTDLSLESLTISDNSFDDDYDFQPVPSANRKVSMDLPLSKEKFQNLLTEDFIKKCDSHKMTVEGNKKQNHHSLQAIQVSNEIALLYISDTSTYVAFFDFRGRLTNDFEVPFSIKNLKLNPNFLSFYALKATGDIVSIDEFGNSTSTLHINEQVIADFVVAGQDIFCAAQNKIFKYTDLLFSVDKEWSITKISISMYNSLLALCLTNDSIQIWNYSRRELLYSLNDSEFTDVHFQSDNNYLITTGQANVAKWNLSALSSAGMNNNINDQSLSCYHRNFTMCNLTSSRFMLVLQTFKNDLDFCSVDNGILKHNLIDEDLKAICFSCFDHHAFIGFETGVIKVYDLITLKKIGELDSLGEVKDICAFAISKETIGLVVYHSGNEVTIFHLHRNIFTISKTLKSSLPTFIYGTKFFLTDQNRVTLAIICDKKCILFQINGQGCSSDQEYDMQKNILDIDISLDNKYFCAISNAGEVKIWNQETKRTWSIAIEGGVLRKCKFRPKSDSWDVVAIINDYAIIHLVYFSEAEEPTVNKIIEDFATKAMQLPQSIKWTTDSAYLLVGDYDIRKLKIPMEPLSKRDVKLPLTVLQTYFGGIQHIHLNDNFICTVDRQGFFYVLKKLD